MNERSTNEAMSNSLGMKTMGQRLNDDVRKVDGEGPNLDSKPNVLGTAWCLHQPSGYNGANLEKQRAITKQYPSNAELMLHARKQ